MSSIYLELSHENNRDGEIFAPQRNRVFLHFLLSSVLCTSYEKIEMRITKTPCSGLPDYRGNMFFFIEIFFLKEEIEVDFAHSR